MKKVLKFTLMALIVPALLFSGCKKENTGSDERQTDPEFQTLTAYMSAQNLDLDDVLADWITTASAIKDDLASYNIIDIREADVYNAAHVPGAVNSTLGGILTTAAGLDDKPIIVVCYSGQTAGHAVCALRLSGYADAQVLKWGMSGWGPTWPIERVEGPHDAPDTSAGAVWFWRACAASFARPGQSRRSVRADHRRVSHATSDSGRQTLTPPRSGRPIET